MTKLFFLIALTFSINALAEGRECRAILLEDGVGDPRCIAIDEGLDSLADGLFNDTACNLDISLFTLGQTVITRDPQSANLLSEGCEWEIRANNGAH